MPGDPDGRIRLLVEEARQRPPDLRIPFLRTACGPDHRLFDTVSAILADTPFHEEASLASTLDLAVSPPPPSASAAAREFLGTSRYVVERRLGEGGFGVVYQARDNTTHERVALKTLQHLTSGSLARFKREFRSLADVTHRNLVQLYELTFDDGYWFFTMEFVDGTHFPRRSGDQPLPPATLEAHFRQLVEGLAALHESGHLHRDVKPANVLLSRDHRIVVVDFGLALHMHDGARQRSLMIAGTPAYMSPEQAAGLELTAASDWYSVGVMFYEALTGQLPFSGPFLQMLTDKQSRDPAAPRTLNAGVAPHFDDLCVRLLDRDPSRRPAAREILERLTASVAAPRTSLVTQPMSATTIPVVAREREINLLDLAFQRMSEGTPMVAAVSGPSGIGKSTLVKAFLARVAAANPDCVVLSGRCYERESVPYKALDSLVDSAATYLNRLPEAEAAALLPRDTGALSLLFPVLNDLRARTRTRTVQPLDPREARRRGTLAMRDLLARIGERHPLVLFVDDLQWGDVDSATLLSEAMRSPDAPVLLFVAAYRDVEIQTSPFLRSFLTDELMHSPSFQSVRLDPLSADAAEELAVSLLSTRGSTSIATAKAIASESGGSPFFIAELVRFAETSAGFDQPAASAHTPDTDAREASLAQMIRIRLSRMGGMQRMLQLVAVNGRPILESTLTNAAGVSAGQELAVLRAERLLRARQTSQGTEFEPYHDRIREIVVAGLPDPELRECHRLLAAAYERETSADPELLAQHHLHAGDLAKAGHYTMRAAHNADRALAFEHSARLYGQALELPDDPSMSKTALWAQLARALTNAGRCLEAAALYDNIPTTSAAEQLQFKTQAAQQFLFGGRVDEGLRVTREALGAIGLTLPQGRWQTLAIWLRDRARLRLRGLGYRERAKADVPEALANAVDACWSIAAGLSIIDTMRGAVFQTRHLLFALDAGDIERLHRALCLETAIVAARGPKVRPHVDRLLRQIEALAARLDTPRARAFDRWTHGLTEYLVGRWDTALPLFNEAESLLTDHCTGVIWELDSVRFFALACQYFAGDMVAMARRVEQLTKDAADRQDLYATVTLRGHFAHWIHLAEDNPTLALKESKAAMQSWSQPGFQLPQLWELWAQVEIALYEGRGREALERIRARWGDLRRSLLLFVHYDAVIALDLRARAELAAALDPSLTVSEAERLRGQAAKTIRALRRQGAVWANGLADLADATLQHRRGVTAEALAAVTRAETNFTSVGMDLHAVVARRRKNEWLGGDAGQGAVAEGDAWMRGRGIVNPSRMARMIAPAS